MARGASRRLTAADSFRRAACANVPRMADDQIELLLTLVRDVLHEDVVGAYLHGSAVLGGLRPRSDLDVMVVSKRRTNRAEKQQLISQLLALLELPRFRGQLSTRQRTFQRATSFRTHWTEIVNGGMTSTEVIEHLY